MLCIEAWQRYGDALSTIGNVTRGKQWQATATAAVKELRKEADWCKACGMHASADAINAGFVDESEAVGLNAAWFD